MHEFAPGAAGEDRAREHDGASEASFAEFAPPGRQVVRGRQYEGEQVSVDAGDVRALAAEPFPPLTRLLSHLMEPGTIADRLNAVRMWKAADEFTYRVDEFTTSPGVSSARAERLADAVLALAGGEPPESVIERGRADERYFDLLDRGSPVWRDRGARQGGKAETVRRMAELQAAARDGTVVRLHQVLSLDEISTTGCTADAVVADPLRMRPELYDLFASRMALDEQRKYVQCAIAVHWAGGGTMLLGDIVAILLAWSYAPPPRTSP